MTILKILSTTSLSRPPPPNSAKPRSYTQCGNLTPSLYETMQRVPIRTNVLKLGLDQFLSP